MNFFVAILTVFLLGFGAYLVEPNMARSLGISISGFLAICAYELNLSVWGR